MTYAEKIIARASAGNFDAVRPGDAIFARADWRYAHEYVTPMCISFLGREMGDQIVLHDRASIVCFGDHLPFIHLGMSPERRARGLLEAAQALAILRNARAEVARLPCGP